MSYSQSKRQTIGIYAFFENNSGRCLYIGQSTNLQYRRKQHMRMLKSGRHGRKDFVQWWINNGSKESSMNFQIVEYCNSESLNSREIHWFNVLKPAFYGHKPTLNGNWSKTEETKKSISSSLLSFYLEKNRTIDYKLLESLQKEELSSSEIAEKVGSSQPSIINLLNKHKFNNQRLSQKLEENKSGIKKYECDRCKKKLPKNLVAQHKAFCFNRAQCNTCSKPLSRKKYTRCAEHS